MPNIVQVPTKALEVIDGAGQTVAPEQGDDVEILIKGTVQKAAGKVTHVMPESYNELPYEKDIVARDSKKKSLKEEEDELLKEAEDMDNTMSQSTVGGNPRTMVY